MTKIIGFAPCILQVVLQNDVQMPIRHSAVVYLKNFITSGWCDKDRQPQVHEQDRAMIRDIIMEAIVHAPEIMRVQLCLCLKTIFKCDFPGLSPAPIADKIHIYLQSNDPNRCTAALLCLYQLIKRFSFFSEMEERAPFNEFMNLLLPMIYNLMVNLQADQSAESVLMQKLILKCFYGLTKFTLPLDLITREEFTKWMEVLRRVMEAPVPDETLQVDEDERMELPWWKCKKWAIHCLYKLFKSYGSPLNAQEEYISFAEWYLSTFTGGILEVLLRVFDQYRNKIYVSPRVLKLTLNYIDHCVSHAHSWKLLKPHMFAIIQDVLFPLMSFSATDVEMWETDPQEYIRLKHDIFIMIVSPVMAAQFLLQSCCKKRKDLLERTMFLCMQVLTGQGDYGPKQKDGVFHMVGTLSDILMKKKCYKDSLESLLSQYIFPEFQSPLGFLRARACWVICRFADVLFKTDALLLEAVRLVINALLNDRELIVKVEAAIALQLLLSSQDKVHAYLNPQVKEVTLEVLKVARETENVGVAMLIQKIVPLYTDISMPLAYEITEHLAGTFSDVFRSNSGSDEIAIKAMTLLDTMKTILGVMENSPEIMKQVEPTILRVIGHILNHCIVDYYEEAMTLTYSLTMKNVSEDMWKVLELLYQVFGRDCIHGFTELMPVLHNFITVDTNAFLSNENRILAIFNMVKVVLNTEGLEEKEHLAAKLLEVMVLQCSGKIDNCLPSFVELVLNRLTRKLKTPKLRTMLLQVLIAILYCNPPLLFTILDKLQESVPNASITQHFIKQWIQDADCFMGLHDKKLSVLGICTLLEMGPQRPNLEEVLPELLPSCLVLFNGLKKAYESRAEDSSVRQSKEDDDNEVDAEVLSSDDESIDEMNDEYQAKQGIDINATVHHEYDDTDEDEDDFNSDDVALDGYTTPLDGKDCPVDEYVKFRETITALSRSDPALYHALTSSLNEQQQKQIEAVFVLAHQRKAHQDSKRIEQSGGYSFTVPAHVPTIFNFGS